MGHVDANKNSPYDVTWEKHSQRFPRANSAWLLTPVLSWGQEEQLKPLQVTASASVEPESTMTANPFPVANFLGTTILSVVVAMVAIPILQDNIES